jgi:hypothetical protein
MLGHAGGHDFLFEVSHWLRAACTDWAELACFLEINPIRRNLVRRRSVMVHFRVRAICSVHKGKLDLILVIRRL